MTDLYAILKSKIKPKEKTALLAAKLKEDNKLLPELIACFKSASKADRGSCIEAIELITGEDPKFAECCLDFVIELISDENPRVKWEAARVIANVAKEFPERSAKAVPMLLENADDDGTVVRWSAAKGLTEVAKYNSALQAKLIPIFSKIIEEEDNNGVKNIYVKALKALEKKK